MLLRLLEFRPDGQTEITDRHVREKLEPSLLSNKDVRFIYSARSRGDESEVRQIVSVWDTESADEEDLRARLLDPLECEDSQLVNGRHISVARLALTLAFETTAEASILRMFKGQTRPGELVQYVEDVRVTTLENSAADSGPIALFLAAEAPDQITAISIWTDWDKVSEATGATIQTPIGTRNQHRLKSWEVAHYEIIPNTVASVVPPWQSSRAMRSEAIKG